MQTKFTKLVSEDDDLRPSRMETVDVVRGIAILMMVYTHFFWYIVTPGYIQNDLIYKTSKIASFYCVPLFYFIVGYTLVISLNSKLRRGYTHKELYKYVLIRAFLIYIFGLILNLYRWGVEGFWNWGTLEMIAFGYVICYVLLNRPIREKLILIGFILALSFMLEPYYWTYNYTGSWDLNGFFLGALFSGENPVIPWLTFFVIGTILAKVKITKKFTLVIFPTLSIVCLISLWIRSYIPLTKWPATLTYNLLFLSACVLLFIMLFWIIENKKWQSKIFYPFRLFGMYPLTLFMAHVIIGRESLTLLRNNLGIQTWNVVMFEFILIFIITFIIITIIGHLWKKYNFKYGLEWLIRTVSYKALKKKGSPK